MKELNPIVHKTFQPHTPQRLFWDQQMVYNSLKDKRQMKWHLLVIRFALNLKYLSTSSYKAMRQSGILHLPSERTLNDYTHWTTPHSGVNVDIIEEFVRMMEDVPCGQNQCTVSMDEMSIKSGLVFNKHSGSMVGFVNLGGVNRSGNEWRRYWQ